MDPSYSCVPPIGVSEAEVAIPLRRGGVCHGLLADRGTSLAVVVCHPWGPLGGSLWDVVVEEVVELFGTHAGLTTLRFNFRSGVGSGASSAEDVRGACALLLGLRSPPNRLLLVGYSYGSLVVASVADDIPEVVALALISPPLYWAWALFMCNQRSLFARARQSCAAKLLLLGERDNFCSVAQFQRFADSLQGPTQAVVLRGAVDHFNVFRYVREHLTRWACATFGVARVQHLATSNGELASPSGSLAARPVGPRTGCQPLSRTGSASERGECGAADDRPQSPLVR